MHKLQDELITSMLEVMNIPKSGYVVNSLMEKLSQLNPKYYTEVMRNLMDNQDRYAKPIEKVSSAIQKTIDRYNMSNDSNDVMAYLKRSYRGKVISDHVEGVFKNGVKIALSVDGENLVNLYNGQNLSDGDTIEVIEWIGKNMDKVGVIHGYEYDHTKVIPIIRDEEAIQDVKPMALISNLSKEKGMGC